MPQHRSISRRRFIACTSVSAAVGFLIPPTLQAASTTENPHPKVDLHVHLSDEITFEKLAKSSRESGCKYGLVEHPGPRYSRMIDDASLNAYLDQLSRFGFYKGVQPVDLGWRKLFSEKALARLDYVLMDAMEIPDKKGGYEITWKDDFGVDDVNAFMDRYVAFYVQVLKEERPNILASVVSPNWLVFCCA